MSTQTDTYGHGNCVAMIERNGYSDSDFVGIFAVHAPDGTVTFTHPTTGSTAYSGGFIPVPDATPTVLAAYRAARTELLAKMAEERAANQRREVVEGRPVTIVEPVTRGKNKTVEGATGVATRVTESAYQTAQVRYYGTGTVQMRVQVTLDDGRSVWVDERRVRVTGHETEDRYRSSDTVDSIVAAFWPAR